MGVWGWVYVCQRLPARCDSPQTTPKLSAAIRKEAVEDTTLGPYKIPKGTTTLVSLWGLAHNPDTWPDPWRFDPSRWLGPEAKERSPYASIPFSVGPRGCLGRQLSIMEQRSILVHTVRRYHLRLHSRSAPRFTTPLFLKPHGIYLSLEKKANAPDVAPSSSAVAAATSTTSSAAALGPVPGAGAGGTIDKAAIPPDTRILLLYGSNMGTCEGMAGELAQHVRGCMRASVGARVTHGFVLSIARRLPWKMPCNPMQTGHQDRHGSGPPLARRLPGQEGAGQGRGRRHRHLLHLHRHAARQRRAVHAYVT